MFLQTIVLFLCVCSCLTLNLGDVPCGIQKINGGRIVNGTSSYHGEFPWMVSIRNSGNKHFCGAAVVTAKHLISAAHCFKKWRKYTAVIGANLVEGSKQAGQVTVKVKRVRFHPQYRYPYFKNDLAILELKTPLCWTDYIQPICLPDNDDNQFEGEMSFVTGWGWHKEAKHGGRPQKHLQKVRLPVLKNDKCISWFLKAGHKIKVNHSQVCAGYQEGMKDSCQGDSGGPMMVQKFPEAEFRLVGCVSAGVGCGREYLPGIYTRVSSYLPWIKNIIGISGKNIERKC